MSLQSEITTWRAAYDQYEIDVNHDSNYIGSICDVNGNYHTGNGIYDLSVSPPTYSIYDFNCYAGQGVDHITPSNGGGKYLVTSTNGFSWDTTYNSGTGKYTFTTSGELNKVFLGYTPIDDYGPAPACETLATFEEYSPLIVIKGFDIAVDYVATLFGGADGNSAINMGAVSTDFSATVFGTIMSNSSLYTTATLNSAVLYTLAFDTSSSGVTALEFVLDKYLESLGSDITDSFATIQTALTNTGVEICYYDEAGTYAPGGVIPCCDCDCNELQASNDLLLAA